MDVEGYIKELSPELQERARQCGSVEEIIALARKEKIPMPDEVLAAVAGGEESQSVNCGKKKPNCPYCGKNDCVSQNDESGGYHCSRCNKDFDV